MKDTERAFYYLEQFLNEKGIDRETLTEEQFGKCVQEFIDLYNQGLYPTNINNRDKSIDLYDEAMECDDEDLTIELLEKAIKLDPNNFDAKVELAHLTHPNYCVFKVIDALCKEEKVRLEKEGIYKEEDIGHFYGILETRPYIRAKYRLANILNENGMYPLAKEVCEEILELNENDNLGARFLLMSIYGVLGNYGEAMELYSRYPLPNTTFSLYECIAAFRSGEIEDAYTHFKELIEVCPDFLVMMSGDDKKIKKLMKEDDAMYGYYRPNSYQEVMMAMDLQPDLFENDAFCEWSVMAIDRYKKEHKKTRRKTVKKKIVH